MGEAWVMFRPFSPRPLPFRVLPLWVLLGLLSPLGAEEPAYLPPLVPDSPGDEAATRHPGKMVWADLFTSEIGKAKSFYSELFGWKAEDLTIGPIQYVLFRNKGVPVAGAAELTHTR